MPKPKTLACHKPGFKHWTKTKKDWKPLPKEELMTTISGTVKVKHYPQAYEEFKNMIKKYKV